jgi:DNA polymerase-3 subunit delta'
MNEFTDILGHSRIKKALVSIMKHDRVSHAYIFEGADGVGKLTMANAFARALNCLSPTPNGGCGVCSSCVQFDSGGNPDIILVAANNANHIGVDDIRAQANRESAIKPYKYRYKIFVIENAHSMTAAAQNALLKTLEEPPAAGVFILTRDAGGPLLPTIVSRCQTFGFRPLAESDVIRILEERLGLTREKAGFLAACSGGSIGTAQKYAGDDGFEERRETVVNILDGVAEKDVIDLFKAAEKLDSLKEFTDDIFRFADLWYRDVAFIKLFGNGGRLVNSDFRDRIRGNAGMTFGEIFSGMETVLNARMAARRNASFKLTMEIMLLRLRDAGFGKPPEHDKQG